MKWIKAWLRTRKALRTLEREIDVQRIKHGIKPEYSIQKLSRGEGLYLIAPPTSGSLEDRFMKLCQEYLIVKRIGADAAVLYKLAGDV